MKFSVVVPSFNQGAFLRECLDSIFAQQSDGLAVEVIVIDGASDDGSREIIEGYADRLAHWVSEPDRGQTHALIKGFAQSSGEVMGWLNSDDMLMPGALAAVARAFAERPDIDVVYGDMNWIDKRGGLLKTQKETDFDLDILLWVHNYLPQPSTYWRRSIWERAGGLDEAVECAMDYGLWLRFAKANAGFAHLHVVLSSMRMYPEQKNQRLRALSNREDRLLRERFLGRPVGGAERLGYRVWHKARRIRKRLAISAY